MNRVRALVSAIGIVLAALPGSSIAWAISPTYPFCASAAETEPNNTPSQACLIDHFLGKPIAGTISPAGDKDYYAFTAPAGEKVFAYVDTGGTSTGTSRAVTLTLYGTDGITVLQSDTGDGTGTGGTTTTTPGSASIAGRKLPGSGTFVYFVSVTGTDSTSTVIPYALYVSVVSTTSAISDQGGPYINSAHQVLNDTLVSSSYPCNYPGCGLGFFAVYVPANSRLFLSQDLSPDRTNTAGLGLVLYDQSGTVLIQTSVKSSYGTTSSNAFDYLASAGGIYYIQVSFQQYFGQGNYTLWIHAAVPAGPPPALGPICANESEPNNTSGTATPIPATKLGCGIQGSITPVGDIDYYSFQGQAGDSIFALVDTGGPETGTSTKALVSLMSTDGTSTLTLGNQNALGNNGSSNIQNFSGAGIANYILPSAGTFYLEVSESSNAGTIVPYRLFLQVVPSSQHVPNSPPDGNIATANGSPYQTTVWSAPGNAGPDFYSFSAETGKPMWISTTNGSLVLYTSSGSVLLGDLRTGSVGFDYTAPSTGIYYAAVTSNAPYQLLTTAVPGPTWSVISGLRVSPSVTSRHTLTAITLHAATGAVCSIRLVSVGSGDIEGFHSRASDVTNAGRLRWTWMPRQERLGVHRATVVCSLHASAIRATVTYRVSS